MPLRSAIYFGRTIEKIIEPKVLYRSGLIKIPTPEFFVFYNGEKPYPDEKILKLSDSYLEKSSDPMLELSVKVININLPTENPILAQCRPLYEYSWFIQRIRDHMAQTLNRDEAIVQAMKDCEAAGILVDFLKEHGSEAVNMLFTEFNMEDALAVRYEEGITTGKTQGTAENILEFLKDLGDVPSALQDQIYTESDLDQLKKWLKLAARVSSVDEFRANM